MRVRTRPGRGGGPGALPSSGSRLLRRTNARMASGARGTQAAGPACDAAPAARSGLQVARQRMRVTDHRFPRTGAEQRGGGTSPRRPGQRASPGAARRAELVQHCGRAHVPAVVRNLRSWSPGHPDFGGGDWVWSRWGSCSDSVARTVLRSRESPDLCFRFRREKSDDPQTSLFCARASLTLYEGCLNRCHTLATPRVLFLTW